MAYGSILGQNPTAQNTLYNNAQTSSIITANNVQGAIDQLFTSVSNGKQQIASAITDKGVSTSGTDSFSTMAENIGKISTGLALSMFANDEGEELSNSETINNSIYMFYLWYDFGRIELTIISGQTKEKVHVMMAFSTTNRPGQYTSSYEVVAGNTTMATFGNAASTSTATFDWGNNILTVQSGFTSNDCMARKISI